MKKILLLSVMVIASALTYTSAQTQEAIPESAHWSIALKGGVDYFNISPRGADFKDNGGWGAGLSIERTANPFFGYGLNVDYLTFARESQPVLKDADAKTIDPSVFFSINLSNLLVPTREKSVVNVYSNFGAGASIVDEKTANITGLGEVSPLAYSSLALEANLGRVLALGLEAGYRGYINPTESYVNYNDAYTLMATLRCKLGTGSKTHVRNMTRSDYYPAPAPVVMQNENPYDDSNIINRLDNIDRQNQDIMNRLGQLENDVKELKNKPLGSVVNASFDNIEFDFDSANITSDSYSTLDQIASILKDNATWGTLKIKGHTDSTGPEAYNQSLSERRANAVKDYLIGQGVSSSVISTEGYGESQPIATNDTAAGRQSNRRVEFEIAK